MIENPLGSFSGRRRSPSWAESPMKGRARDEVRAQVYGSMASQIARSEAAMIELGEAFERLRAELENFSPETLDEIRESAQELSREHADQRPGPRIVTGRYEGWPGQVPRGL